MEPLCQNAFHDRKGRIFLCMYADKLDFTTSISIENLFLQAEIANRDYQLVFICSKDNIHSSYLATALDKYKVQVPDLKESSRLKSYIEQHLQRKGIHEDTDPSTMRIVQSELAGKEFTAT